MAIHFDYPKGAAFGRILPKSKIYEHGTPSSAVKELFIRQVEQIVWQYKLAPETVNLTGTRSVPEIQIFSIALKDGELKQDVLRCIDQAIPFPILFELRYEKEVKGIAAYKRPSEADGAKWVVSDYFETEWVPGDTPRKRLPLVFDLEALYTNLLTPLMPCPGRPEEGFQARIERMEKICSRQRELERCEARLRKEKQFNCKVAINAELRALKQELENLTRPFSACGSVVAP
ncbi:MAG: DUF4391 domain-containing protein [Proteobacteria bacterium]|nr:DUF4391 domain-containing protein [Pseudomonadota bacterium]